MIHQNYLSILHRFIEPYKQDTNVIGIFLVWSYAYGNPNKNSDIDVYIITDKGDTRTKWTTYRENIEIEYFINPLSQVQSYLLLEHSWSNISTTHMLSHGTLLYDTSPEIQKLITQAQDIRKTPIPEVSNTEKELMKYDINDLSQNLEDYFTVENYVNFHITQTHLVNRLISILFKINQRHIAKKHSPYQEIMTLDKEFWDLLNNIYLQSTLHNKYQATKKLAEYIEDKLWWPKTQERSITWPCIY